MSQQIETAAERYRRLKADRQVETFDFTSPSGMTWKLRKPNLALFIASGQLPLDVTAKLLRSQQEGKSLGEAAATLNVDEQIDLIAFTSALVEYCAVSPQIVQNPTGDDQLAFKEVELDDYNAIVAWANSGGGEADSLNSFRQE